jgi:hypothetical protein
LVVVPKVAELPTCQNTPQPTAPLINITLLSAAVVSVLPIWKINRGSAFPSPSRVSVPVSCADEEKV